ncbi:hypothetical protein [Oceanirhabdus seepicola]|uniref:Uncharacterized protein n=1 Tax=Oceanirhabdus seepicola TaxID=2828781 RepID=A0A9J6P189_9CLOT|nr:hypothetical protein [Oceanirhabdus seepicola]MCM1990172.1 hypothetical protein [Oceanirhabdus seepicola]
MDKEKIFIINYFNKNDMRWYEQEKYKSREKYINTITGATKQLLKMCLNV